MTPQLWVRNMEWSEWRQMHPDLQGREAEYLYNLELKMFTNYQDELRNQAEFRKANLSGDLLNTAADISTILNDGGVRGQAGPVILTYNAPGTFSVAVPSVFGNDLPYNQVTIEAVGGGGVGTRGKAPGNAIWIGAGGGGGAYSKKAYPITSNSSISVTVGAGSSTHEVNGGNSTATVDGVTITAGGGESLIINNEDDNGDALVFSEIAGPALGGTASGGDININGGDSEPGQGRAVNNEAITGPPDGIGDGGDGAGPFGGAGGITSKFKTIVGGQPDNGGGYTDEYAKATNGQQPGGGGGGGGPKQGLYYNFPLTPGSGGNGRVVVTFGYS